MNYLINTDRKEQFEQWLYPGDGACQVRLKPEALDVVQIADEITFISTIQNATDVIILLQLADAVWRAKRPETPVNLVLPYYPYARADRPFTPGDTFGLEVFEKQLAIFPWNKIFTFDKHSNVQTGANLPVVISCSSWPIVQQVVSRLTTEMDIPQVNLLLPDQGAVSRFPFLTLGLHSGWGAGKVNVLLADKKRDAATGKLLKFIVPARDKFVDGPVLVPDDLCDGGGTYIGLADEMKDYDLDLYLYVSHGLFSKGFTELQKRFKKIFTTNTWPIPEKPMDVVVFDALSYLIAPDVTR